MIGGWAAVMPRAGQARSVQSALRPESGFLRSRHAGAAQRALEPGRAARLGQAFALVALGLLSIGVYGAVLNDPDAVLRLDRLVAEPPAASPAAGEPAPGTERQAWYRSGLGTVINPLLQITYPASVAWLAPPRHGAEPAKARLMPYAMFSAPAPSSGGASRAASMAAWLTGAPAGGALGEIAPGSGDDRLVLELGPDGALHARIRSAEALALYFEEAGYDLEMVRDGLELVPRRYVATLPPDLDGVESVDERKQLFIKAVLPVVLRVNEELEADRARLAGLADAMKHGDPLGFSDQLWLDAQYRRYEVEDGQIGELLRRVDIIPPSLALAQAAEESGWGTSRFAREGNALFGQYTDPDGPGIEPLSEAAAGKYRIRSYDSIYETVRSYALNLNHHRAYEKFREMRAELRTTRAPLDGHKLAGTLTRYSERGKDYIKTIRVIMKENDLRHFDDVRLHDQTLAQGPAEASDGSS